MSDFKLNQIISVESLIELVKLKVDRKIYYSIYSSGGDNFSLGDQVLVDSPIEVDNEDKEIYPESASRLGYKIAYSGEQFQDVVDLAIKQKPRASAVEIIEALNYYSIHDNFLDL
ncbi:DUF7716 domain-containing protein [Acinetobacter higginsii]|uniref:DUF7716 domain-containing protein n=1 Tax=Acinetobacter higginsii TaxID=70347 RepID=UPI001F4A8558|nr:hypothetical protein [Acinetobacter higginsii]MCH7293920.1 hypothetical protein [Acinetobacter higginsii]MCH7341699.1 hypothetical protein [Acinetobacter higginsii]